MQKLDKLEIIAGTVVEVQIIERQVEAGPTAGGVGGATIIGRQRIFLDGPGVADPHYDFDRCELAVRRDQEVAFARIPAAAGGKPVNVMLFNRTMGTPWPFDAAIDQLAPKPVMDARMLALLGAIVLAVVVFFLVNAVFMPGNLMMAMLFGGAAGLAGFLALWAVFAARRIGSARHMRETMVAALIERLKSAPIKSA